MIRRFYTLTLVAGLGLLSPYFLAKALRHKKYLGSLRERLGNVSLSPKDRQTLWIHAVSVGELLAVEQLIRQVAAAHPDWRLVVSTTTATGNRLARERLREFEVIYFPLDLPRSVARVLDRVCPDVVCLVETEIWPNFLAGCAERSIPVLLVNGRISDRSFGRYRKARRFLPPILANIDGFLMQSDADASRIRALGALAVRIETAGNVKYDVDLEALEERFAPVRERVDEAFKLPDARPLVIAGSTSAGEESIVADALRIVRRHKGLSETRLLVAPRHPERFDEAAREFESRGLAIARRSDPRDPEFADVLLLDSIGELGAVYQRGDVVFVGGSLVPLGGHNILEPALYGRPIIVGPHTENFRQIVSDFRAADALVELAPEAATGQGAELLAKAIVDLLLDPGKSCELGVRGSRTLGANRGATARILTRLEQLMRR